VCKWINITTVIKQTCCSLRIQMKRSRDHVLIWGYMNSLLYADKHRRICVMMLWPNQFGCNYWELLSMTRSYVHKFLSKILVF
jgi:hypothetical protein